MSIALTVTKHWTDNKKIHVTGTLAFTGDYTTGGDTLSVADPQIKSSKIPEFVDIKGIAGYSYRYIAGADNQHGLVKVFGTNNVEVAQAGYNVAVTGDTINIYMVFPKFR